MKPSDESHKERIVKEVNTSLQMIREYVEDEILAFEMCRIRDPNESKIVHNVVIASERGFNHPIERLHNTIRERTKTMRGFHGCIESAHAIINERLRD